MKKIENSDLENGSVLKKINDAEIREMRYKDNIFLKLFKTKAKYKIFYKIVLSLVFFCSGWFCYFASSLDARTTKDVLLLDVEDDDEEEVDFKSSDTENNPQQNVYAEENLKVKGRKPKNSSNKPKKLKNRDVKKGKPLILKNNKSGKDGLGQPEKKKEKETRVKKNKDENLKNSVKGKTKKGKFFKKPKKKISFKDNLSGKKIEKNKNSFENEKIKNKEKNLEKIKEKNEEEDFKKKKKKKPKFGGAKNKTNEKALDFEFNKEKKIKRFLRKNIFKNAYNKKNKNLLDVSKKLKFRFKPKLKSKPKFKNKPKLKRKPKLMRSSEKKILANLKKEKNNKKLKDKKIKNLVDVLKNVFNKRRVWGKEKLLKRVAEFCLNSSSRKSGSFQNSFCEKDGFGYDEISLTGLFEDENEKESFAVVERKGPKELKNLNKDFSFNYCFDGNFLKLYNLNNKKTFAIELDEETKKILKNNFFKANVTKKNKMLLNSEDELVFENEFENEKLPKIKCEINENALKFTNCNNGFNLTLNLNEKNKELVESFLENSEVENKLEEESFASFKEEEKLKLKNDEILKLKEDLKEGGNEEEAKFVENSENELETKTEIFEKPSYAKNSRNRDEEDLSDEKTSDGDERINFEECAVWKFYCFNLRV